MAFTVFNDFLLQIARGTHKFHTDTIRLALSNVAPSQSTHDEYADITPIATGNGWAGPVALANVTLSQTGGVCTFDADDVTVNASGGSIGPYRYVVLYNDTSTGDKLIGYWDLGSSRSITDGNSTIFKFVATGILTISQAA